MELKRTFLLFAVTERLVSTTASPVCMNGSFVRACVDVCTWADPGGASASMVHVSTFQFRIRNSMNATDGPWTINLAPTPNPSGQNDFLGTGTMLTAGVSYASVLTDGGSVGQNADGSISVTGVAYGPTAAPFATEAWSLAVVPTPDGEALQWNVTRQYIAEVPGTIASDRLSLAFVTTGAAPITGNQIPGFLDADMFFDFSAGAGYLVTGSNSPRQSYQFLSPHSSCTVLKFEPGNVPFRVCSSAAASAVAGVEAVPQPSFFSFAKPYADGTATLISLGLQAVDPRGQAPTPAKGSTASYAMQWELLTSATDADIAWPQLNLSLPNATLNALVQEFVSVQNQFLGWIFGNNPASVPCLHEMSWFALIQGMFPPNSAGIQAVQQEVEYIGACGWDQGDGTAACRVSNRSLTQRWASSGFYNCQWGPLQDQSPHFIIAVHAIALATGNKTWVSQMLPAAEAVATYLRGNGIDATGLFVAPAASGLADGGRHTSNWYDIVEFGYQDAFLNALTIWAMESMADMYAFVGDATKSAEYAAVHGAMQAAFNATFWRPSVQQYADWIDEDGNARLYLYTDVAFLAILTQTAGASQAAAMVSDIDLRVSNLTRAYNLSDNAIWSMPCNLIPITNALEFAFNATPPIHFPSYENGGSFFHTVGFETVARTIAGCADGAYAAFEKFMLYGFTQNRAWAQQLYWDAGELVGFDPLNNALLAVWGFLRGGFGFWPTLSQGVRDIGSPAGALEGATYTFAYLGQPYCLRITGGSRQVC